MMRLAILVPALLWAMPINADNYKELSIGIVGHLNPAAVQIIIEAGVYDVVADGNSVITLRHKERLAVILSGTQVELTVPGKSIGKYKQIKLRSRGSEGVFRLFLLRPHKAERVYDDNLHISPSGKSLKLINRVELEKYVAGVVEAEAGKEKGLEFYKVQAIISRTYALSNMRKHLHEGFNLNDRVDCQVYHGKCRWEPEIVEAVLYTKGKVLVDSEMKMITAAFHSNSGGETVSSDVVWSGALPYLISRRDEFSINGEHYHWSTSLPIDKWLDYLSHKYGYKTDDYTLVHLATHFEQPSRQIWFVDPIFQIPLKEVRRDWKLRSTWFDIKADGDSLRFTGRGFGHGTGLSQEGAMRMAELGFTYVEILHFYYNEVHVVDLEGLAFYRDP